MRAAVYVRISRDADGQGAGVDRQEADCRALVKRQGWTVAGLYADNSRSAYSGRKRPEYLRLLEDVAAGLVDVIVCWHPDRLHRSPAELEAFIDLLERTGTTVATCTAGDWDLSTPEGRLTARVVGAVARKESEDKSRRLRRKALELAREGKVGSGGGHRPFGYEADRVTVNEAEALLVREAAERVIAGDSLYAVCRDWNERGVATVTGAKWSTTALRTFLESPRIAGYRDHHTAGRVVAVWPAVLDAEQWERLCRVLESRSSAKRGPTRRYLLSGVLSCGVCGAPVVGVPRSNKSGGGMRRGYGCALRSGCGKVHALADPLEAFVVARVLEVADSAPARAQMARERDARTELVAETVDKLRDAEEALQRAEDALVAGVIGAKALKRARQRYEPEIAEGNARLETLRGVTVQDRLAGSVAESWEHAMTTEDQRAVIRSVVREMALLPWSRGMHRTSFDPRRVRLRFRWDALLAVADSAGELTAEDEAEYRTLNAEAASEV